MVRNDRCCKKSKVPVVLLTLTGDSLAQRNDTWNLADMYEIYTGKKSKVPNILDRGEHGTLVLALRAEDLKRRIEEAKTLLNANGIKVGEN